MMSTSNTVNLRLLSNIKIAVNTQIKNIAVKTGIPNEVNLPLAPPKLKNP
jgi:hypothetical protein